MFPDNDAWDICHLRSAFKYDYDDLAFAELSDCCLRHHLSDEDWAQEDLLTKDILNEVV